MAPTRELLDRTGLPYVIEQPNGRAKIRKDVSLCGVMFGLKVFRHRNFELGNWSTAKPVHVKHDGYVRGHRRGVYRDGPYVAAYGKGGGKATVRLREHLRRVRSRRRHVATNAAEIAKAPRLEEEDIEPFTIEEVQSVLVEASKLRNSARWVVALALGLRQGEALGLHWEDVDLGAGYIRIRKNRLRPKYAHGCGADPCGRKAGYCPKREQTRREHKSTKSRAGRRTTGLPAPLIKILRRHQEAQERERIAAGVDWEGKGYVFASPVGGPLSPNTDFHVWKRLLRDADVRDGRLHDARHTAATVLLILGVPDVVIDSIMGWEPGGAARMRARYMHVTGAILRKVAQQVGDALWMPSGTEEEADWDGN
ncbi:tyrosine-type recombinase/integrase [Streptomyces sp. LN704]|uniref:tyrosine-type recombinase/integrase n=1 Tax=Streptomyces sp. LN704 TaxID=3112982 RepID=UPI00371B28A8